MKFRAVVEYDEETQSYGVYCPKLPGWASAGDTELEALANIREAIALYLEPASVEVEPEGKVLEVEVLA
jgi:predicted RNase H-like HicB family nuclease